MAFRSFAPVIIGAFLLTASAPAFAQEATPPVTPELGLTTFVWELAEIQTGPDALTAPDDPTRYTVQFFDDGQLAIGADCNRAFGSYRVDGSSVDIEIGGMTMALCEEGSLSDQFVNDLDQAVSFILNDAGDLALSLPADAGFIRLTPSLAGVVWEWTGFQSGDGSTVAPDDPSQYTIEFLPEQAIAVGADCNRGRGSFSRTGSEITIEVNALTRANCPPESLSNDFIAYLNEAATLTFADGQLHLALPVDSGILSFSPLPLEPVATPSAG